MKILKDEDRIDSDYQWGGKDYFFVWIGMGLCVLAIAIGIGGCCKLASSNLNNKSSISISDHKLD
jgi:hypothetical protein